MNKEIYACFKKINRNDSNIYKMLNLIIITVMTIVMKTYNADVQDKD